MSAIPQPRETFRPVRGLEILPQVACLNDDLAYLLANNLPYDDGAPLETNRHRLAMGTLIDSVAPALLKLRKRLDFFTGGNMFIHYLNPYTRKAKFVGPDFFVMLNVDCSYPRKSWNVVKEGGHYPDVIVELLSDTTAKADLDTKKTFYEQVFNTAEYFVFDPYDPDSLQGWRLVNQRYQALSANSKGWLWSDQLSLWLGTWEGAVDTLGLEYGTWLRFYDREGQLALLSDEHERREKEYERHEKELAQQQAEQAQQQVEQAQQEAALARLRAERLTLQLRALGINPDNQD
jgi:Uma2 family endonuclease